MEASSRRPHVGIAAWTLAAAATLFLLMICQVALAIWWTQPKATPARPPAAPAQVQAETPIPQEIRQPLDQPEPPAIVSVPIMPAPEATAIVESIVETQPPLAKAPKSLFKWRSALSDEELRKQLLKMPEMNLSVPPDKPSGRVIVMGRDIAQPSGDPIEDMHRYFMRQKLNEKTPHSAPMLLAQHTPLRGLPFRMGDDCQLGKEPAETMQALARRMRGVLAESTKINEDRLDQRLNPELIRSNVEIILRKMEENKESAIPCLMQMLQPESTPVRQVLLDQLATIQHRKATDALVKLALFDLSDRVRVKAIKALAERQPDEYREQLLEGLRYPWPPVADHAAEALVALQDREAVPALERMLYAPDPTTPHYDATQKAYVVNDVVRINHLSNCMMCHAVSSSTTDLVRGRVPSPDKPLPPMTQYYEDNNGIFVRADATYLKQDFSVYQPVANPGQWPTMQRYDYVVRRRPLTSAELQQVKDERPSTNYPQRQAVAFALKELK
jgi:HEAT repeat protein